MIASLSKAAAQLADRMIGGGVSRIMAQWIAHKSDDVATILSKGSSAKLTQYEADKLKSFASKVKTVGVPTPEVQELAKQAEDFASAFKAPAAKAMPRTGRNVPIEEITGQAKWNQQRDVYGRKL